MDFWPKIVTVQDLSAHVLCFKTLLTLCVT